MSDFVIDPRTAEDIRAQIAELAKSYTPEWVFDREKPDIGSVIALIFSRQMEENVKKLNQVLEKYHTEFVNMLSVSLKPAYPAGGVVTMELVADTVPGIDIPRGTKLLGTDPNDESGETIIFETVSDVHITNARLRDIIQVSGSFGKIIPLRGRAKALDLVPRSGESLEETLEEEEPEQESVPIVLFDYDREGIEKNCLLIYHGSVFETCEGVEIFVNAKDGRSGQSLAPHFADPARYRWSYYAEDGFRPFDKVSVRGGAVALEKSGNNARLHIDGKELSLICLEAVSPPQEAVTISSLRVSSACDPRPPAFVTHNDQDQDPLRFLPFGDTASVFDECYIGHDYIFSQQGALVTMEFELSYEEKLVSLTPQQTNEELKVIKRKPRTILYETAHTFVERIAIEYFNGIGWRRLPTVHDYSTLFDGSRNGSVSISFVCPSDWERVPVGGYDERAIRLRIAQADNCYLRPCLHTMPRIENLRLGYSYLGEWKHPHKLERICGTAREDLTGLCADNREFVAFSKLPYAENALLLGFDAKITGAPVSILFDVQESVHFTPTALRFEYSTVKGWKPLKVIDHTDNMSNVGTVLFMPPSDFSAVSIEGQLRWWIRIVDADGAFDDPDRYHAVINRILPNAVEILNVETLPEEQFYVEVSTPNMSFPIAAENILSAEVFVNEKPTLSPSAMRKMLAERPEDVRVTYNFLGDISEFFVRWEEVPSFDESKPSDRHYTIDRQTSTIHFGDGVNVMIPPAQTGVAFTVEARCCRGSKGNLPAGAVNATYGNILYIGKVENPIATYAGGDIESIESAHRRGANIVNSKYRLVSELDYVREVKSFSTAIDKVKCVVGRDIDGRRNDRLVCIAVMMRDYADGAYSFNSIKERLRQRLLESCEATLSGMDLVLSEPIYVEISVDVWAETSSVDSVFEIQNKIRAAIEEFLNPLASEKYPGWEIGTLPTESQIRMMLQSIRVDALIRRFIATARYADRKGTHERSLDDLQGNPFMIGVSGTHKIHIALNGGR